MKYLSVFAIACVMFLFSCSDNKTIENIDFAKEYPDADAVYLKITKEYTLNEDGSMTYHYYHKLKYLSFMSFNRLFGETFITYNPDFQTLKINKAITYMADGKEVITPDNAFNKVLPHIAAHAPDYNNLKEMIITHTALEPGATVELDYEIQSTKDYFGSLMISEVPETNCPIRNMEVIIKVPVTLESHFDFPEEENITTGKTDKYKITKIELNNLKAIIGENNQDYQQLHFIEYSTSSLQEQIAKFIKQPGYNTQLFPAAQEYLKTQKGDNNIDNAMSLQNFVVNSFNTYNIPLNYTAYRFRAPEKVWSSNGGTEFEKTLLLQTLLSNSGYKSQIVYILSSLSDVNAANMNCIRNFYVEVEIDGKFHYLSAIKSGKLNTGDKELFIGYLNENTNIKEFEPEVHKADINGILKIEGNNYSGTIKAAISDNLFPEEKYQKDNNITKSFMSCKIKNCTVDITKNDITSDYDLSDNTIKEQSGYLFLDLPEYTQGINTWNINWLSQERKSDIKLLWPVNETYTYKIVMPSNIKYIGSEVDSLVSYPEGQVHIKIYMDNDTLNVIRHFDLNCTKIPVTDYNPFKNAFDLWNNKNFKEIVFKK